MEPISFTIEQVVLVGAGAYVCGWLVVRLLGGGYVTKSEFRSYVNQNEIDKASFSDKLVKVQQRYAGEESKNNKGEDDFLENIIGIGIRKLLEVFKK